MKRIYAVKTGRYYLIRERKDGNTSILGKYGEK